MAVELVPNLRAVGVTLWNCFQAVAQAAPSFGTAFLASSGRKWALELVPNRCAGRCDALEAIPRLRAACADPWKWFHASPLAVADPWKWSQAVALAAWH